MVPLINAKVVTEIKALKILTGVDAYHVASGGLSGGEGSVTLVAEGSKESMNKAIALSESIKGEVLWNFRKGICEICVHTSPVQPKDYDVKAGPKFCRFQDMKEKDLPLYLRNR